MRILFILLLFSSQAFSEEICKPEDLNFPENMPEEYRQKESDFSYESAMASLAYLSKIVKGDISEYHWIAYDNARNTIDGYTLKLLAIKEIKHGRGAENYNVKSFCNWLIRTPIAD